ncbi:MAG: hypothetical protein Q8O67_13060 [Deltaproteobacteria bacterium]|nr:hypothetical protein [Deltaproteobacteria bacterium]
MASAITRDLSVGVQLDALRSSRHPMRLCLKNTAWCDQHVHDLAVGLEHAGDLIQQIEGSLLNLRFAGVEEDLLEDLNLLLGQLDLGLAFVGAAVFVLDAVDGLGLAGAAVFGVADAVAVGVGQPWNCSRPATSAQRSLSSGVPSLSLSGTGQPMRSTRPATSRHSSSSSHADRAECS